jgi:hypothetical protein
VSNVQRAVLLLGAILRVLAGSKNLVVRQISDRRCGLVHLMTIFRWNTQGSKVKVKVRQSYYRPSQALKAPAV